MTRVYIATLPHFPGCSASVTTNPKQGTLCSSGAALTVKGPAVHLSTHMDNQGRQPRTAKCGLLHSNMRFRSKGKLRKAHSSQSGDMYIHSELNCSLAN